MNKSFFLNPKTDRIGWLAWGLYLLVVCYLVGRWPEVRNITHHYRDASLHWWASEDLYTAHNMDGFLYLPQSAVLFTPFGFLPITLGELLWRLTSLGALAWGVWRLAKIVEGNRSERVFLLMTFLAVPASLSSARSGQFNMIMGALMIHASVDLILRNWSRSAFWLCLAVGLKPLAIVLFLLCGALQKELRVRLLVGACVLVAIGFLHANMDYVLRQWQLCWGMLTVASGDPENKFCDLGGLLRTLGYKPSQELLLSFSALFSIVTLGLCYSLYRRKRDQIFIGLTMLGLASAYLMIFNPRNETNSYVILSPVMAAFCIKLWLEDRRPRLAVVFAILTFLLGSDSIPRPVYQWTNLWLKVLIAMFFMGFLAIEIYRKPTSVKMGQVGSDG